MAETILTAANKMSHKKTPNWDEGWTTQENMRNDSGDGVTLPPWRKASAAAGSASQLNGLAAPYRQGCGPSASNTAQRCSVSTTEDDEMMMRSPLMNPSLGFGWGGYGSMPSLGPWRNAHDATTIVADVRPTHRRWRGSIWQAVRWHRGRWPSPWLRQRGSQWRRRRGWWGWLASSSSDKICRQGWWATLDRPSRWCDQWHLISGKETLSSKGSLRETPQAIEHWRSQIELNDKVIAAVPKWARAWDLRLRAIQGNNAPASSSHYRWTLLQNINYDKEHLNLAMDTVTLLVAANARVNQLRR